jgi:hypothetical protein
MDTVVVIRVAAVALAVVLMGFLLLRRKKHA